MKELSIFVDESGDFGEYSTHSPYYVIALVLHDQGINLSNAIKVLDSELKKLNVQDFCIHTEPLIRKEESYRNMDASERRTVLTKLFYFATKIDIKFMTFVYEKKNFKESLQKDSLKLESKIVKDMNLFILCNKDYFKRYNKVILYYDNGQKNITRILNTVLATNFNEYDIRKVLPKDYKLFQVADLICTLELIKNKIEINNLSKSETLIFHSKKELRKDFIKTLWKKKM